MKKKKEEGGLNYGIKTLFLSYIIKRNYGVC